MPVEGGYKSEGDQKLEKILADVTTDLETMAGGVGGKAEDAILHMLNNLKETDDLNGNSAIHNLRKLSEKCQKYEEKISKMLQEAEINGDGTKSY